MDVAIRLLAVPETSDPWLVMILELLERSETGDCLVDVVEELFPEAEVVELALVIANVDSLKQDTSL